MQPTNTGPSLFLLGQALQKNPTRSDSFGLIVRDIPRTTFEICVRGFHRADDLPKWTPRMHNDRIQQRYHLHSPVNLGHANDVLFVRKYFRYETCRLAA